MQNLSKHFQTLNFAKYVNKDLNFYSIKKNTVLSNVCDVKLDCSLALVPW